MRPRSFAAAFLFIFVFGLAGTASADESLKALTDGAVAEDGAERARSVAALRAMGQAGLDALFEAHSGLISRELTAAPSAAAHGGRGEWLRLSAALDAVSQQRDSFASRLYWYTDFEEAKRAARASGKPILSLRLLGNLSDEYSCANSRFFRTALYPNAAISKFLRERYVLHWKSVRPVPRLTVDFGDGRKLERTLTGNSIHYILDSEGWPIDALPGLYGPGAFLRELMDGAAIVWRSQRFAGEQRRRYLLGYHEEMLRGLIGRLSADVQGIGAKMPEGVLTETRRNPNNPYSAERAGLRAVTKMAVEMPTVKAFIYNPGKFDEATDAATWIRIAGLHSGDALLDDGSVSLVRRHNPKSDASAAGTAAPLGAEQLARVVRGFERRMALDTVRNEYLLRSRLHKWFIEGAGEKDVDTLNERVYTELFLTPSSDPWLGLLTPDTYTALENDGIVRTK
jgi:hypothetical protein